mmetsp:Transcript_57297/g.177847  ORF Transcript_57297/g.177847 Transcript_57297/m.177847 type:complete len:312 (-) Transcript_57297:19-954(-)
MPASTSGPSRSRRLRPAPRVPPSAARAARPAPVLDRHLLGLRPRRLVLRWHRLHRGPPRRQSLAQHRPPPCTAVGAPLAGVGPHVHLRPRPQARSRLLRPLRRPARPPLRPPHGLRRPRLRAHPRLWPRRARPAVWPPPRNAMLVGPELHAHRRAHLRDRVRLQRRRLPRAACLPSPRTSVRWCAISAGPAPARTSLRRWSKRPTLWAWHRLGVRLLRRLPLRPRAGLRRCLRLRRTRGQARAREVVPALPSDFQPLYGLHIQWPLGRGFISVRPAGTARLRPRLARLCRRLTKGDRNACRTSCALTPDRT